MGSFALIAGANLAACIYVGYLAQTERDQIGALWALITFAASLLWHGAVEYVGWYQDLELAAHGRPASLIAEDAFTSAHIFGLFLLAQVMAVVVWTLPSRSRRDRA
jgi:hypothetical protein